MLTHQQINSLRTYFIILVVGTFLAVSYLSYLQAVESRDLHSAEIRTDKPLATSRQPGRETVQYTFQAPAPKPKSEYSTGDPEVDSARGRILYIEARSILNSLPDVTNPDNIGRYYQPRRSLWNVFLEDGVQSICHTILFPIPKKPRSKLCGFLSSDTSRQTPQMSNPTPTSSASPPIFKNPKAFLSPLRQQKLQILETKQLELKRAFELLADASYLGNIEATYTRAEFFFYGNYTHTQDFFESLKHYQQVAQKTGNSTAQFMVGFMYSTGMFGSTPQDQAKANLYYTFAARGGNYRAKMAMAYRHYHGIATPKNSKLAAQIYKETATIAHDYYMDGPPGGRHLSQYDWLLSDKDGGIFGEGASRNIPARHYRHLPSSSTQSFDMAVRYLNYLSLLDDTAASAFFALGRLYFDGDIVIDPNYTMAFEYASECIKEAKEDDSQKSIEGVCAGFLGSRYLRGEGVEQNFEYAKKFFQAGVHLGDDFSATGLGLMYMEGLGVEKDEKKAIELFKSSEISGASFLHLGRIFLKREDLTNAYIQFDKAVKKSNLLGIYHFGMLLSRGTWSKESDGVPYFQIVSERVHEFHSPLRWAHKQYAEGDFGSALLGFMIAAEEGYSEGQTNTAYMLDNQRSVIDINRILSFFSIWKSSNVLPWASKLLNPLHKKAIIGEKGDFGQFVYRDPSDYSTWAREKDLVAFTYWTRLANSFNIDALVKVGDYFLNGIGVKPDPGRAASQYQIAADYYSSIARWNLGWMYENGIGVEQDFHLAKRYYDNAALVGRDAYFPVTLSLFKLRARSYWNSIWRSPTDHRHNTFAEPITRDEEGILAADEEQGFESDDTPQTFIEGIKLFWKKWKERGGFSPDLPDDEDEDEEDDGDYETFVEAVDIVDFVDRYFLVILAVVVLTYLYRQWRNGPEIRGIRDRIRQFQEGAPNRAQQNRRERQGQQEQNEERQPENAPVEPQ